jgi:SPP1 family predicted phage head-tail adaptor
MSFSPAYGDEITITTRTQTGVDEKYGNPVYTETTVTVTGAFAPAAGTETTEGQDQVVSQPLALLPYGTEIDSTAKLTINGLDYEIDGEPQSWSSPFVTWQPGISVPLKRITG